MRVVLVLFTATLFLTGCKREAQEAVARAKGAAEEAERAAKDAATSARDAADQAARGARTAADQARAAADDAAARARAAADQAHAAADHAASSARAAADQARAAADDAAARARAAADQARAAVDDAAAKARGAAGSASDSAKHGLDSTGQKLREMTAGDQVTGTLDGVGAHEVSVRAGSGPVQTFRTDPRTRWILHGAAAGKEGFSSGSRVRVTYIVDSGRRLATQVEAVPP
jgi:hypothetical protein